MDIMINSKVNYKYRNDKARGIVIDVDNDLEWFNSNLLNIGDLSEPSKPIEVLAVILDLEGFTTFTRQVDPKLAIPNFVSDFFDWLFDTLKVEMRTSQNSKTLWSELPFFCKFLGDGVLLLWKIDTDILIEVNKQLKAEELTDLGQELICNIVATLYEICSSYQVFLTDRELNYVDPPSKLRCGIARGDAFPLGGDKDFVGPCINIASRLQKFSELSFAVSARGIDYKYLNPGYQEKFSKKKVSIRGIGENEIIYILKDEFKKLPPASKALFKGK
jgi:class 3 adenylate cyclase